MSFHPAPDGRWLLAVTVSSTYLLLATAVAGRASHQLHPVLDDSRGRQSRRILFCRRLLDPPGGVAQ
jgi:hypothetical protein